MRPPYCFFIEYGFVATRFAPRLSILGTIISPIATFVNNLSEWYSLACNSIMAWAKDTYKIEACMQDIELTHIFVLFEQNAEELFGLEFRVEFDIEHGCGIKIRINDGKYDIVEVGTGDVAFC